LQSQLDRLRRNDALLIATIEKNEGLIMQLERLADEEAKAVDPDPVKGDEGERRGGSLLSGRRLLRRVCGTPAVALERHGHGAGGQA
jgi:hypothetical protein